MAGLVDAGRLAKTSIDDWGSKQNTTRSTITTPINHKIPSTGQDKLSKMAHDDNSHRRARSTSRSRPTTPLRPSSRSSFRDSARNSVQGDGASFPLNTFEPAFAELSDAVADLEANMMHFQLMHESLARFSESFASFLYGLNMNAFCVDFPEVGILSYCLGWSGC